MRRLALSFVLLLTALAGAGHASAASSVIGQVREFPLGAGTRPEALVAGPDGNLWFAGIRYEPGGFSDVVGRVTPKGKVAEFTLDTHTGNLGLSDIAVGPDGNLWFAVGGRPKIGRITPAGSFTEFELPDPSVKVAWIAAGPDGNLWFTEFEGGKVGRITPGGEVTEFAPGNRFASAGITAGPDGALWITQPASGLITRLATDGSASRFSLPDSLAQYPWEIVAGSDGALWFGLLGDAGLGRITQSGELSKLAVPGGDQTYALSSGPFDSIWYSNGGGRIGWVLPGVATGTPACINSCRTPIAALAEGPEGKLWFAAGIGPLSTFSTPGTIGTYAPPPLEIKLVGDGNLRGETLRLPVTCPLTPAGGRCKGRLRLAGPGGAVQRRLSLLIGGKRRVSVRLPVAAKQHLAERGQLALRATTSVPGGRRDTRRIVLHRG
jgi:streptogramin lyase